MTFWRKVFLRVVVGEDNVCVWDVEFQLQCRVTVISDNSGKKNI